MKLQTTITQTKEIEITLPVFFKENASWDNYIAVINEQTAIHLYISKDGEYTSITHTTPDMKNLEIKRALDTKDWSKISEVDFLQAYDDAISSISLRPQLHDGEPQDFLSDLNKLDLKRNDTLNTTPSPTKSFVTYRENGENEKNGDADL